ncbi:Protein of unknown function [Pyronema omphalodes CBS 100304]|uniref:Uncharacterized protein n=1 Tax=Pyronema omphalodes (strain CBS 100304) TaxID=1076935 RepID=U4L9D5_PYROM|nr:Protein of unknown function [Pyronema omphalodes CBS 100304]
MSALSFGGLPCDLPLSRIIFPGCHKAQQPLRKCNS